MTRFPNMLKRELETNGTDLSKATSEQLKDGKKTVCKKFLAALMLSRANGAKYYDLKQGMIENFVTGTSKYPKSPEAVLRILNAYQPPAGSNKSQQEAGTMSKEGAIFAQAKGGDNSWKSRQDCFKCGKRGRIAWECLEKEGKKSRCTRMLRQTQERKKRTLTKGRTSLCRRKKEE
jgi:hypothetical protein